MMKLNRKWAAGIGVALSVGAVFWLRALASWRPVVVAKVGLTPSKIRVSKDGRYMLVDGVDGNAAVLNIKNGSVRFDTKAILDFYKNHELETYPHFQIDQKQKQLNFWPERNRKISLLIDKEMDKNSIFNPEATLNPGWSEAQDEVYMEFNGEIWTWNEKNGHLKTRLRYRHLQTKAETEACFSPDGKWMLACEESEEEERWGTFLHRYNAKNGKRIDILNENPTTDLFGFSPDGKWIWFMVGQSFNAASNSAKKITPSAIWSENYGPAHWLPDGRIGVVRKNGFEWQLPSGQKINQLPGPSQTGQSTTQAVTDWALSPDGNWIYSAEQSGIIRKWRAR